MGGFVAMWLLFTVPGRALRQHAVGLGILLGVGCLPFINEAYALSKATRAASISTQARVPFRDPAGRFELTASRGLKVEVVPQGTGSERSQVIFRTAAMQIDVQVTAADPTLAERDPEKLAQLLGELGVTARGARRRALGRATWTLLPLAGDSDGLVAVATNQAHSCVVQCTSLADDAADVHRELELMLGTLRF